MTRPDETDEALFERWVEGDSASAEDLFARHFASIYRFFRNKVDQEAEELTQRTFLGCLEAHERFRQMSSFRTFLFGIARNILREYFRERARDERLDFATVSLVDLGASAPTLIAETEEQKILLTALRTLPLETQELLELYYWQELSISELAELLAAPAGTIKRWLWQARKRLLGAIEALDIAAALRHTTATTFASWSAGFHDESDPS